MPATGQIAEPWKGGESWSSLTPTAKSELHVRRVRQSHSAHVGLFLRCEQLFTQGRLHLRQAEPRHRHRAGAGHMGGARHELHAERPSRLRRGDRRCLGRRRAALTSGIDTSSDRSNDIRTITAGALDRDATRAVSGRGGGARGTRRDIPTFSRAARRAHAACTSRPRRCPRPRPIAARRSR